MTEIPTLFVCHGDDGGPRVHPCRRVQEALGAAEIEYEKVIAAHGSPIPFLRRGSRDELREATGATKLPLKLAHVVGTSGRFAALRARMVAAQYEGPTMASTCGLAARQLATPCSFGPGKTGFFS